MVLSDAISNRQYVIRFNLRVHFSERKAGVVNSIRYAAEKVEEINEPDRIYPNALQKHEPIENVGLVRDWRWMRMKAHSWRYNNHNAPKARPRSTLVVFEVASAVVTKVISRLPSNEVLYTPTFWAIRNTRANDEVLVFDNRVKISARVDLADMRAERTVGLVKVVFCSRLWVGFNQISEVIVPVWIGSENRVILSWGQENGSSLSRN